MSNWYKIAGVSAIIQAILFIPLSVVGFMASFIPELVNYLILTFVIDAILSLLILGGFIYLGKRMKLPSLKNWAIVLVAFSLVYLITDIVNIFTPLGPIYEIGFLIVTGVLLLFFGLALLPLEKKLGTVAKIMAIFYIISGVAFATVLGILIALPLLFAITILEAVIFFKASHIKSLK